MVRLFPLALSVASVSAFSRAVNERSKTSLAAIPPEKEVGVLAPVGFFDPLDLVSKGPYGSEIDNFYHYRGIELKHGRIAMAATLGMLVQENYRFYGLVSPSENLSFQDVPNGLAALGSIPLIGWVQMAVVIGAHEVFVKPIAGKKPGDFGTGYFGILMDEQSSAQLRALNIEVQNGRLAMLGILGMFASENIHKEALWETKIFSH